MSPPLISDPTLRDPRYMLGDSPLTSALKIQYPTQDLNISGKAKTLLNNLNYGSKAAQEISSDASVLKNAAADLRIQPTQKARAQLIESRRQEEQTRINDKIAEGKTKEIAARQEAEQKLKDVEHKLEHEKDLQERKKQDEGMLKQMESMLKDVKTQQMDVAIKANVESKDKEQIEALKKQIDLKASEEATKHADNEIEIEKLTEFSKKAEQVVLERKTASEATRKKADKAKKEFDELKEEKDEASQPKKLKEAKENYQKLDKEADEAEAAFKKAEVEAKTAKKALEDASSKRLEGSGDGKKDAVKATQKKAADEV